MDGKVLTNANLVIVNRQEIIYLESLFVRCVALVGSRLRSVFVRYTKTLRLYRYHINSGKTKQILRGIPGDGGYLVAGNPCGILGCK